MENIRGDSKNNSASTPLYFEELELGQIWVTDKRAVTADDVGGFAALTGDRNPIHLDPDFASTTPFKRCIAHGLLGISLAGGMALTAPRLHVIALLSIEEWKFTYPVFIGDSIRVRQTVVGLERSGRGRRGTVRWGMEVLTSDDRVVQSGVSVILVQARGPNKK